MKVALAQLDFTIGDFEGNLNKIEQSINEASLKGADLVVFSELAISGYPPRDFLDFKDFIKRCEDCLEQLLPMSHTIAILVGCPTFNPILDGKDLYNSAVVLYKGQKVFEARKALLPTYDIFDEYRYFEPAGEFNIFEFKGTKIAITICEDIWNIGNENPLYTISPMDELSKYNPDIAINISASPFSYGHAEKRKEIVKLNAERYQIPFIYVNQVGAQTEILFDGGSLVWDPHLGLVMELPYFEESLQLIEWPWVKIEKAPTYVQGKTHKMQRIHQALIMGIRGYFSKLGFQKAVLGISGGIDSALTAVLAAEALGPANVYGIMMPGPFSSQHSIDDAKELASNLGIVSYLLPIHEVYESYLKVLKGPFENRPFDITEENIQARIRGMYLMAFSNKFGMILLNTSNKSEAAVGYGTLYGDMCGGLSVIGDLYKTEVYALAEFVNRDQELIPQSTISKPPSAELRPGQKDSDSLPDYSILDQVLYLYIEEFSSPGEIVSKGYDPVLVHRILRMVNQNEFKRYQSPPVLRVSSKAFGMGRRLPIVGKYLF